MQRYSGNMDDSNRWTRGKSYRPYQFTVKDFAKLYGMTEAAVHKAIQRGKLKPYSLESICRFWQLRCKPEPDPEAKKQTPD